MYHDEDDPKGGAVIWGFFAILAVILTVIIFWVL